MKITKSQLKQLVKEELTEVIDQASVPVKQVINETSKLIMSAIESAMNLPAGEDGDQVVRKLREASMALRRMRKQNLK